MRRACSEAELKQLFLNNLQNCKASALYAMYAAFLHDLIMHEPDPNERLAQIDLFAESLSTTLCSELFTRMDVIERADPPQKIARLILLLIPGAYFGYDVAIERETSEQLQFSYKSDPQEELYCLPDEFADYKLVNMINRVLTHALSFFDIDAELTTIKPDTFELKINHMIQNKLLTLIH